MSEMNIVTFPMKEVEIGNTKCGNPIYFSNDVTDIMQKLGQREISDGIYPDDSSYLQTISNGDMTVAVKAGYSHIQGVHVWVKEDVALTVEAADTVARVDRIVLRLSIPDKNVVLAIKKGDTTLTKIAGQTWELGLADIAVAANATEITPNDITDLRADDVACGYIHGDLTVDGEYSALETTNKKVIGAINEVFKSNAALSTKVDGVVPDYAKKVLYVSESGNDTTGNGTSGGPYRTLQKAVDSIKSNWYGLVTINLTTNADTLFGGLSFYKRLNCSMITVTRTGSNVAALNGLVYLALQSVPWIFENVRFQPSSNDGCAFDRCSNVTLASCAFHHAGTAGSNIGVTASGTKVMIISPTFSSNPFDFGTAFQAYRNGEIYVENGSGSVANIVYNADGGFIHRAGTTGVITPGTLVSEISGGKVF